MTKTLNQADLAHFTGSEQFFRHALNRSVIYTEGVQYLAEHGGAYWLIDEIALAQRYVPAVAAEEFQLWNLSVAEDRTAILACEDGNGGGVFTKAIEYTDFPLTEIKLYYTNGTLLLPSEY